MAAQAKLAARFVLDDEGRPKLIERGDRKHYWIDLYVDDAPEDTYSVNYQLHPSYYDPLRESREPGARFVARLSSYGDYTVQARLRTKNRVEPISSELSEALARGHRGEESALISEALDDIRDH